MRIGDIFLHCNDIHTMREFYTNYLKLEEVMYNEQYKHLVIKLSDDPIVSLVIMESKEEIPINKVWDKGPVFREGTGYAPSWSVRVDEFDEFKKVVDTSSADITSFSPKPQWVGYWSWMIKDPMGNTIDLYCELSEQPEEAPEW